MSDSDASSAASALARRRWDKIPADQRSQNRGRNRPAERVEDVDRLLIDAAAKRLAASAPPLTPDQRRMITALLAS